MKRERAILIAGGGTGGHVYPGLAVAAMLRSLADVRVVFVGTARGIESRVVGQHGFELELLEVVPMKGGGPSRAVHGALVAARAMRRAAGLVRRYRPSAVLSVGGYAAGPAALAAVGQGVPLAVLEPNSTLGLANRLLAPFAKRGYVAWPETSRHFRSGRARMFGVPLRAEFVPSAPRPKSTRRILVLGGSLGAAALNDRVPKAIARVVRSLGPVEVVHQCGREREAQVREAYEHAGVTTATVAPFFDDVATQLAEADIVIARAGASSVAELSLVGRASILIPFPHAADDHQAKNALALEATGGCICLRQAHADEGRIADELQTLLSSDAKRTAMADAARKHGRPHATRDIAEDLLSLANLPKLPRQGAKANGSASNGAYTTHASHVSHVSKESS